MNLFKKIILGAILGLCIANCIQPTQQVYNFRWYLMNVLEQHCQDLSGSTKKIGAKNPCLISLDPLIQTSLLSKVLVDDNLVKKRAFLRDCKNHMTTRAGTAKLSEREAWRYCKQSYTHFKQAHTRYKDGPKLAYAIRVGKK